MLRKLHDIHFGFSHRQSLIVALSTTRSPTVYKDYQHTTLQKLTYSLNESDKQVWAFEKIVAANGS